MTGSGHFADLIARRFELACRRLGLNREDDPLAARGGLDCSRFRPPVPESPSGQLALF